MKILRVFAWLYPMYAQMNVAAAVVGSAVVGGAMSASASKKAANAQSASADQANETQRYQFDETNRLNAPFREAGVAGINQLQYLMGLGGGGVSGSGSRNQTLQEITDSLRSQYTTTTPSTTNSAAYTLKYDRNGNVSNPPSSMSDVFGNKSGVSENVGGAAGSSIVDYAALNAAAQAQFDRQQQEIEKMQSDPSYGSLLRNFGQSDLDNDVIYQNTHQYAQDQGNLGVNRLASASGSQLSGATLKALQKSGANIANQYGNDAFNRNNIEKTNTYNRLAGISGVGQQATNQVAAAGQNMANQVSNNQIGVGNARGASAIAQGNAWNNALSTGANAYQQQNYMNSLNNYGGSGGYNDEMARLNSQAGSY